MSKPPAIVQAFRRGVSPQASLRRKLAYGLAAAAVISCFATAVMLVLRPTDSQDIETVLGLIYLDGALLLLLGLVVAQRLFTVWLDRRRGRAGASLHVRMVLLFSLVASAPAILVAVMAATFLHYGIQAWFNERVSTALDRSLSVARAYLEEHRQSFGTDMLAVANDLNTNAPILAQQPWRISRVLTAQTRSRGLTEAIMVDGTGRVLAQSDYSLARTKEDIPSEFFQRAAHGKIVLLPDDDRDRVRGMLQLDRYVDSYLVLEKFVNPQVLNHIDLISNAVSEYKKLEKEKGGLQISFILIFTVVSVLLLLAAIWTGLTVATQMAEPISNLISAAERVRDGDLTVRVEASAADDEISSLTRAFNRMTAQIRSQQEGLMHANRELDERRRFTETVLAGVSAGVVGLDQDGQVNLPNRSASVLLDSDMLAAKGRPFKEVVPEMADIIDRAMARPDRMHRAEIKLMRGSAPRMLTVRVAAESLGGEIIGYVVTFDDVTELLSAQRTAAWADVARRIAHEIKNPLTPIQLSAERLKRKYQDEITSDPEVFVTCTETIVRQVEDIGRMVDEFSSFARMPQASMNPENLGSLIRDVVFLERTRNPKITIDLNLPEPGPMLRCDRRQVTRALTNIIKNAVESVEGRQADGDDTEPGAVVVTVEDTRDASGVEDPAVRVTVADNGIGLPAEDRDRLTEPYVTTRTKGTGLGLAIVKKIMEDHQGDLLLADRDGGGAVVSLVFRDLPEAADQAETDPMKVATGLSAKAGA